MNNNIDPKDIIRNYSVEQLCEKAEKYFRNIQDINPHITKPFGSIMETPELLYQLSMLIQGLLLGKTMKVLEFGAGTCWLSRLLNQMQCSTISLDPSNTALEIGKMLFKEYGIIGSYIEEPEFLLFNGREIQLEKDVVDRIICFDSFHHVPNQYEVLKEFYRVAKKNCVVGFCEAGRYHSSTPQSQYEMKNYGVLENDIIIEDIVEIAEKIGFEFLYMKPVVNTNETLSISDYIDIIENKRVSDAFLDSYCDSSSKYTLFFFVKDGLMLDSRISHGLNHEIQITESEINLKLKTAYTVIVKVKNTGSAKWLANNIYNIGVVNLGVQLYSLNNVLINMDYIRVPINRDVFPNEEIELNVQLLFENIGTYLLNIDLVSEGVCWFENMGAVPKKIIIKTKSD